MTVSRIQRLATQHTQDTREPTPQDPISAALAAVVCSVVREEMVRLRPEEPRPTLLDRATIARELSTSVATIDRLCREGLPFVRLGDVRRFELACVLEWLRDQAAEVSA